MAFQIETLVPGENLSDEESEVISDIIWTAEKGFFGSFTENVPRKKLSDFQQNNPQGSLILHAALTQTREIVGIVLGNTFSPDPQIAHLNWVITQPEFQKRGIATSLVDHFEDQLPAEVKAITAETKWESRMYSILRRRNFEIEKTKKFTVRLIKNR